MGEPARAVENHAIRCSRSPDRPVGRAGCRRPGVPILQAVVPVSVTVALVAPALISSWGLPFDASLSRSVADALTAPSFDNARQCRRGGGGSMAKMRRSFHRLDARK